MGGKKPLEVGFYNFWPGFNPHSFFVPMLEKASGQPVRLVKPANAQLVIHSVFDEVRIGSRPLPGRPKRKKRGFAHAKNIWFTGENVRPPVGDYDLTISFDRDSFGGRNVFFPLILMGLDWFSNPEFANSKETIRSGVLPDPKSVASQRTTDIDNRPKFMCAFIGNPEPIRMLAVEKFGQIGEVDVFGKQGKQTNKSKAEIAQEYKFMLCFENDMYPNYVTEKVLDAWGAGCVPVWRGEDESGLLNNEAILSYSDFGDLESMAERIRILHDSNSPLSHISSKPLLNFEPSLTLLIEKVGNVIRA